MAKSAADLHIVMLPWSAFGHLIRFYQLSIALAKQGVRVSYVQTPRNIERLPNIPPQLAPLLQYITLPFPQLPDDNNLLPKGAEATVDMENDKIPHLKVAYDLLQKPFKQFLSSCSPDCDWIISDFAAHWLPDELACRESQPLVQLMHFSVCTATLLSFFAPLLYSGGTAETLTTPPELGAGVFPPSVAFRSFEAALIYSGAYDDSNASKITDGERLLKITNACQAVCIRSCREFEGEYIDLYQSLIHKPVVPMGLLPPAEVEEERENMGEPWSEVFQWLDQQNPRSVIYVGFGSEYKLARHEVYEIAYGLELTQLPFIWALRRPNWAADDDPEALPPGFLTRTSGKGIVCLGWAPQLKILAHQSVGGSLFHSGWGSIIETLQHGHNLILLPFIADQGLNARVMVHKGLGVEVERREDGSFNRDDVADALRRAMIGDEAEKIRAQATQAAALFGDHKLHQEHYIKDFVEYLRNGSKINR